MSLWSVFFLLTSSHIHPQVFKLFGQVIVNYNPNILILYLQIIITKKYHFCSQDAIFLGTGACVALPLRPSHSRLHVCVPWIFHTIVSFLPRLRVINLQYLLSIVRSATTYLTFNHFPSLHALVALLGCGRRQLGTLLRVSRLPGSAPVSSLANG